MAKLVVKTILHKNNSIKCNNYVRFMRNYDLLFLVCRSIFVFISLLLYNFHTMFYFLNSN